MTALQHLNRLLHEDLARKYPEIPERLLPNKPMKCNSANTLTQCVLKWLKLHGHQAERINTMGRRIDQTKTYTDVLGYKKQIGSVKWVPGTGTKGSSDISAIVKTSSGKVIPWKIEIKWGKDRISKDQVEYSKQVIAAGGHYSIVRDFQDFVDQYNQLIAE